jgi:hypothetical protein
VSLQVLSLDLADRWVEPPGDLVQLVRYLESGVVVRRVRSRTIDLVHPTRGRVVAGSVLTDGAWLWSAGHAHYVLRYAVRLPRAFTEHVRQAGHVVPTLDEAALRAVVVDARALGAV